MKSDTQNSVNTNVAFSLTPWRAFGRVRTPSTAFDAGDDPDDYF